MLQSLQQSIDDRLQFRLRQHADLLQHFGVRDRALDVVPPQPPIERDGFRELRHVRTRPAGKPPAPRYWCCLFHAQLRKNVRPFELKVTRETQGRKEVFSLKFSVFNKAETGDELGRVSILCYTQSGGENNVMANITILGATPLCIS